MYLRTLNGQVIASKWPRKRGPPKKKAHAQQTRWFAHARKLSKWAIPKQQIAARDATHRTPLMPTDVIMSAMAGRLYRVIIPGQGTYRSLRAMNDISRSLDIVSDVPGAVLVRGEDHWTGMPMPTTASQWFWSRPGPQLGANLSVSPFAFKGSIFTAHAHAITTAAMVSLDAIMGATYRFALARLDGDNVILKLIVGQTWEAEDSGHRVRLSPFVSELFADQTYAFLVGRTDGGPDYALPVPFNAPGQWTWPCTPLTAARLATTEPTTGQTLDTGGDSINTPPLALQMAF